MWGQSELSFTMGALDDDFGGEMRANESFGVSFRNLFGGDVVACVAAPSDNCSACFLFFSCNLRTVRMSVSF